MRLHLASTLILLAALTGCREKSPPGGGGGNKDSGTNNTVNCGDTCPPVFVLKNADAPGHPAVDAPVSLTGMVVTTTTRTISKDRVTMEPTLVGFYVQDPAGKDFLEGRYSGIAVVYKPSDLVGRVPVPGTKVNIEGAYAEFGPMGGQAQKQVKASRVESSGETVAITPVAINDVSAVAKGGSDSAAYEGVLITVSEVHVTAQKAMGPTSMEIFGAFRIDADLIVGGDYYQYPQPQPEEAFTSISGVLALGTAPFNAGEYILNPRSEGEVVPKNAAAVVRSIAGINDPASPDRPIEMCTNPGGGTTTGKCAQADLRHVLVTASGGYVSSNLRAIWVQDPNDADGKYAGVKVVYNKNTMGNVPRPGEFANIKGEVINYSGGMQIQYPTLIERDGTATSTPTPTLIQPSDVPPTGTMAHVYEGTLVKLTNVTVTRRCVENDQPRDIGYWEVGGVAQIGSAFFYDYIGRPPSNLTCFDANNEPTGACSCSAMSRPMDQRADGDVFDEIVGVVNSSFNRFTIEPRRNSDLIKR